VSILCTIKGGSSKRKAGRLHPIHPNACGFSGSRWENTAYRLEEDEVLGNWEIALRHHIETELAKIRL